MRRACTRHIKRQHMPAYASICQHMPAYASIHLREVADAARMHAAGALLQQGFAYNCCQ
jgi:hypothetical protein